MALWNLRLIERFLLMLGCLGYGFPHCFRAALRSRLQPKAEPLRAVQTHPPCAPHHAISPALAACRRFLPSIRRSEAPFSFVVNLIIPGTPVLFIVFTFSCDVHPDDMGPAPDPQSSGHGWTPFDFILHRQAATC